MKDTRSVGDQFGAAVSVETDTVAATALRTDFLPGNNKGSVIIFEPFSAPGLLFFNGFETGTTSAWSAVVP